MVLLFHGKEAVNICSAQLTPDLDRLRTCHRGKLTFSRCQINPRVYYISAQLNVYLANEGAYILGALKKKVSLSSPRASDFSTASLLFIRHSRHCLVFSVIKGFHCCIRCFFSVVFCLLFIRKCQTNKYKRVNSLTRTLFQIPCLGFEP